jgi:hypothetical protein
MKKTPTDDLIALLAKALSERYPNDKGGKPGVLIAHLPEGSTRTRMTAGGSHIYGVEVVAIDLVAGAVIKASPSPCWYVAAQRFMGPEPGQGRTNVDRETGDDLDEVIERLTKRLATSTEHQAELEKAVGK